MVLSPVKVIALDITNELHLIALPYIKSRIVKEFVERFGKPRMDKIIAYDMTDTEVKEVLWNCKKKLDVYFKKLDKAQELFDVTLNDKSLIDKLKKLPDFKEFEELI